VVGGGLEVCVYTCMYGRDPHTKNSPTVFLFGSPGRKNDPIIMIFDKGVCNTKDMVLSA
jgi:hypothetical protein